MRTVLVTGGAGFIGSNFIRCLQVAEPGVEVVNLDLLTYAGSIENLAAIPDPGRHHFVQGDIRDAELVERLFATHGIDTVVHFAAESHVDRSIQGARAFVDTNVMGTLTLLEAARKAWLGRKDLNSCRFHHVSTDEVFGTLGPGDAPFHAGTPYDPRSPYSASKAASDHLVRAYFHTHGLPVTLSNCTNNYGPCQFPEKLIPLMIVKGLARQPLPVYGDGGQIRDWIYVDDHCEAILQVLRRGHVGETYLAGGGNQPTNLEILHTLCGLLDELHPASAPHAELITHVADRPGHDRRYAIDAGKTERELGWRPRHDLRQGLRATVEWYLANGDWLRKVTSNPEHLRWLGIQYGG